MVRRCRGRGDCGSDDFGRESNGFLARQRNPVAAWLHCTSNNVVAHFNLGGAMFAQERWDAAADQYQQVTAAEPENAMALGNLGAIACNGAGRTRPSPTCGRRFD